MLQVFCVERNKNFTVMSNHHFNSVSYEDGRKLHNTRKDLERMKQLTNQMCRERGLTAAEKGKHFDGSQIEKGEVVAWSKGKYAASSVRLKQGFQSVIQ